MTHVGITRVWIARRVCVDAHGMMLKFILNANATLPRPAEFMLDADATRPRHANPLFPNEESFLLS